MSNIAVEVRRAMCSTFAALKARGRTSCLDGGECNCTVYDRAADEIECLEASRDRLIAEVLAIVDAAPEPDVPMPPDALADCINDPLEWTRSNVRFTKYNIRERILALAKRPPAEGEK